VVMEKKTQSCPLWLLQTHSISTMGISLCDLSIRVIVVEADGGLIGSYVHGSTYLLLNGKFNTL